MRLIFIRHPETMANVNKLIYGRTESNYSKVGEASIPWVVEQMREICIDEMYVSPLLRTRYLAEQIAKSHDFAQMNFEDRILEMNFGIFENMTNKEARVSYPKEYEALMNDYSHFQIPEGESFLMVQERVKRFLKELQDREEKERERVESEGDKPREMPEKTIVIVAHSMVIRSALAYLLNIDLERIWHIKMNPASIVDVDYRYGYAMLQQLKSPALA